VKPPAREELGDLDRIGPNDCWVLQHVLPLEDLRSGELILFTSQSVGGKIAIETLKKLWALTKKKRKDCGNPIVGLANGTFPSRDFGLQDRPDFPILRFENDERENVVVLPPKPGKADVFDDSIPW
jgi:hypothetical protein